MEERVTMEDLGIVLPYSDMYCEATEENVCRLFDRFIDSTGLFIVEKEVQGKYLFGANGTAGKCARIDRILIPKSFYSTERGLSTGPIGVEIKAIKADQKWWRPICQAMDYKTASFRILNGTANVDCVLDSVFLFPYSSPGGPVESIMAQHRVGFANIRWDTMTFRMSSTNVLTLTRDSDVFAYNKKTETIGRNNGSR